MPSQSQSQSITSVLFGSTIQELVWIIFSMNISDLAIVLAIWRFGRFLREDIYPFILDRYTSSLIIYTDNPDYGTYEELITSHDNLRGAKHLMAITDTEAVLTPIYLRNQNIVTSDSPPRSSYSTSEVTTKPPIQYMLAPGRSHWFRHTGRWYLVERSIKDVVTNLNFQRPREYLRIACFGDSVNPITSLVVSLSEKNIQNKIWGRAAESWKVLSSDPWVERGTLHFRPMDSVVIDPALRNMVIEDLTEYLSDEGFKWYLRRRIHYRRGYLLKGPPGTGKTSFVEALASYFKLDIYILELLDKDLTDAALRNLFGTLPSRCIVLIEDVDSAGIIREDTTFERNRTNAGVSLSGLLNASDGVGARQGRTLIFSTNKPENLDAALVRVGRVDLQVSFENLQQWQAKELFLRMYFDENTEDLEHMATVFSDYIPNSRFSVAAIEGFLIEHKGKPEQACVEIKPWVEDQFGNETKGADSNLEDRRYCSWFWCSWFWCNWFW